MIGRIGHFVGDTLHHYPHICPGEGCAVQRWLIHRHGSREMWWQELKKREQKEAKTGESRVEYTERQTV